MARACARLPHVTAVSPALYTPGALSGAIAIQGRRAQGRGRGFAELAISDAAHLKAGSLDRCATPDASPPGIVLGSRWRKTGHARGGQHRCSAERRNDARFGPHGRRSAASRCAAFSKPASTRSTTTGRYLDRRRAEGALGGPDQPDRAERGRSEPRAGDRRGRPRRSWRASATPPPPGWSATSNCSAR
jgi:hypothetical protein